MPTTVDRDATITVLRDTWAAIDDLYDGLSEADHERPTCLPGWTVKDQLSHITSTEETLLGLPTPAVDVSGVPHLRNDIATMNEAWVEDKRSWRGAEVLERFRTVTSERLAALDAMDQTAFDAPSWTPAGPDETYGRFMRIRHFDSYHHELDAREALGVPLRDDPAAVTAALEETAPALGYVVGRRAALPAGSRVRIDLTGPGATTYLVEVAARAALVPELSAPPTVSLELPAVLFLRLGGGRLDAAPLLGSTIALGGDTALAAQLATHLAFTI